MLKQAFLPAALAFSTCLLASVAKAEPASAGVTAATVTCPATGEGAAACAAIGLAVHELLIANEPFGDNGEVMRLIRKPTGGDKSAVNQFLEKPIGGNKSAVNQFLEKPIGGDKSAVKQVVDAPKRVKEALEKAIPIKKRLPRIRLG